MSNGFIAPMTDQQRLSITMMSGPRDGETYHFQWDNTALLTLTVGRRDGCDILLSYDSQVSRLHARLICDSRDMEFYLEDIGSRNGTYIGNIRVLEREPIELGYLFRVGRTWMRLDPFEPDDDSGGRIDD